MKYHLARGEEQLGIFNDLDVSAGLREGRFRPTDLCWAEGMPGWLPLGAHLQELNMDTAAAPVSEVPGLAALRAEVRQDQTLRLQPASRGQRLAAHLIDLVMMVVPFMVYYMIVFDQALQEEVQALQKDPAAMAAAIQRRIDVVQASGNPVPSIMSLIMNLLMLANVILLTVRGQTLGKMCLGIQVVRFPGGERAGFVKAVLLRNVLFGILVFGSLIFYGLAGMALPVANVLLIFRQDRRCLHDLVADTLVTRRKP
ncbi:RDD family protein [Prosthecobacter sp.]|uniref:RDD family protein n=1 Tax=Prosthecobacter sp. TaxID=1965333 RepID=UPI003783CC5F